MNSTLQPISQQPPRASAVALLEGENLPASDITDLHLKRFFYTGAADSPTGMVGLEIYGTIALLRSLVVSADARSTGLGTVLTLHAEDQAKTHGVHSLYLLTTTAEAFFPNRPRCRTGSDPIHSRVLSFMPLKLCVHVQTTLAYGR